MQESVNREGHDEVEASKAPLMDHLIELRQRLIYALIGVSIGFVICFAFAADLYNLLVLALRVGARGEPEDRDDLHGPARVLLHQAQACPVRRRVPGLPDHRLRRSTSSWRPGLYKNERQAFRPYLFATFLLFILGAMVVYFIVMPLAMKFFLSMEQTGGQVEIHLQARVSEYLSLIMTLIIGFGVMFQLPVVLTLLAQAGILGAQNLRDFRRYAIVAITAAAGILSPPDPFSMIAMALPTILLYEASILAVARVERSRAAREAAAQAAST